MKRFLFILSILPLVVKAQDLTGTWVGHSRMSYVKLVIVHKGDSILGYTYDEGPGWCQATFSGIYDNKTKYLQGKGMEMLRHSGNHALAVYFLDYYKRDGYEMLNGTVESKRSGLQIFSLGGGSQIFLRKLKNEIDTLDFMRPFLERKSGPPPSAPVTKQQMPEKPPADSITVTKPDPAISTPSVQAQKEGRTSKIVERIFTDEDSIRIALYDNGEVDQDSVTIFFDNAVILNRYMISAKPLELTLALPKDGKEHTLELFAHNLGTIPPNTALVIITAGTKRYELRASYDLNTNAKILFSRSP